MKPKQALLAGALLLGAGCQALAETPTQTVLARLVHGDYAHVNGEVVPAPGGTDQVWAEWTFKTCDRNRPVRTLTYHRLVHSIVFPKPGLLFSLTVSPSGEVVDIVRVSTLPPHRC